MLGSSPTPLHYKEITDRIIADGLRKSLGATPADSVRVYINSSIRNDEDSSPYIRVSKGTFALRSGRADGAIDPPKLTPDVAESEELEEQYELITSFGMFWRKESVEWSSRPKLLGMQQIGATPVDF